MVIVHMLVDKSSKSLSLTLSTLQYSELWTLAVIMVIVHMLVDKVKDRDFFDCL